MKTHFFLYTLAICLPIYSSAIADEYAMNETLSSSNRSTTGTSLDSWQTTISRNQPNQASGSKPHSIGKRGQNNVALQAKALQISMKHLPRLRPYARNYPRLVRVVRAYWRNHAQNPNASHLTNVILQHVQKKYRFFVRPKLHAGISKGINILKRKLGKS